MANREIDFDTYDIGAFKLTLPDGTVYEIQRDNLHFQEFLPEEVDGNGQTTTPSNFEVQAFGRARVVKVTQPTGDVIEIDSFGIRHKGLDQFGNLVETRSLKIDPDDLGRIHAIYVPTATDQFPLNPPSSTAMMIWATWSE